MKTFQLKKILNLVTVLFFSFELFSQVDTDGTYQTATGINLNSSVSGNVGYKINDQTTDYEDWYKFTLPFDGKIEIVEIPSTDLYSGIEVYDLGGTHGFRSKSARKASADTLIYENLAAGEYYVKIYNWSYSFGSYTFSVNFTSALYSNDPEPNNSKDFAKTIPINSEITGHVGFYRNDSIDYDDWYKFTIPSDGKIEIVENPSSNLYSGMSIYDLGGTHEIRSKSARKAIADTLIYENIAAGEYYVRIYNWNYSFGSYKMKVNFYPTDYANDPEQNNSKDYARSVSPNSEVTGHVGFYRNDSIDYDDWYKFTIPSDGKIEIVENPSSNLYSGMAVYDLDGTHEIRSKSARKAIADTLIYENLAAGEYYVRIYNWNYSFGSYKMKVNFYPTDYANDPEPNNSKDYARSVSLNSEVTGHVGFYRNDIIDYDDWFKFIIPSDGKIEIVENPSSNLYSGMSIYDLGGTHEFRSKSARKASADTLIYENLAAGEYYVRIYNWNYCFGSYKMKVNFYPTDYANDTEPNDVYFDAKQLIFNVETTGHVGFYYNDIVDYYDWYWFTLPSSGKIKIVEMVSKDLYSGICLFNTNGTQELYSRYARKGMADTLIYNEVLPAGNYFIRISNWNSSFGSYSLKVSSYNPSSLSEISDKKILICMIPDSRRLLIKGDNIKDVQIFDLFGKVVNSISPVSINETCEIDVSNCKASIYVVKIKQADKVCTEKILIR